MRTPIFDFCHKYAASDTLRFHMPGHKGMADHKGFCEHNTVSDIPFLGLEPLDLTEIAGADSLYEADGIIRESEDNASALFGCQTFYSTEGSSQCIRAMLYLLTLANGNRRSILAGRNAHKTFVTACGLLDIAVRWLYGAHDRDSNYLSCQVTPTEVDEMLSRTSEKPMAVYITSPDYLGNMVDIAGIAAVCHRHGVPLAVDNAHGAYLHFLPTPCHPMDQGADLCCSSAHKTLPALTGCAYLHLSPALPQVYHENVKDALALFGSTSPSYLLLCSLDRLNPYLAGEYRQALAAHKIDVENCRRALGSMGYTCIGDEPCKLTICPQSYGYTGVELSEILRTNHMECEFADPDHLVLMTVPGQKDALTRLTEVLQSLPKREPITAVAPRMPIKQTTTAKMSIREALFAPSEVVPVEKAAGHVLAALTVGCPPAVPIVVCGEVITDEAVRLMQYYGTETVKVVRKE